MPPTIPPSARALAQALEHLRGIREQAADLEALLTCLDHLPEAVEADAMRTLFRIDAGLGELVQALIEAGPWEESA